MKSAPEHYWSSARIVPQRADDSPIVVIPDCSVRGQPFFCIQRVARQRQIRSMLM